jgi:hypothetical protein
MLKWLKNHRYFFLLLGIGFLFRCYFIIEQGLSNDELSAWNRTQTTSWNELWFYGIKLGDMHPGFYQVFLWIWVHLFGESEWSLRSTGLLFFILNSSLIYYIANKHFSRFSGLLTLALLTGLSFAVTNSVFARPYNSGEFFVLVSFLSILEIKYASSFQWKWGLYLIIGFLGAMLSHYFAFLAVGILGCCALFFIGKDKIKWLLLAGIISLVAFIPHLSVTMFHLSRGGLNWLPAPNWSWIFEFIYLFFNESYILAFLFLLIFSGLFFFRKKESSTYINRNKTFGITVFSVVFIVAFILSYALTPILRESALVFILPLLFLGIVPSDVQLNENQKWNVLKLIVVLSITHSIILYRIQDPIHFGVFREQAAFINHAQQKFGYDNIEYASAYNDISYVNYYLNHPIKEPIHDWTAEQAINGVKDRVIKSTKNYVCFSETTVELTPMLRAIIQQKYPNIVAKLELPFSTAFLFGREVTKCNWKLLHAAPMDKSSSTSEEFFGGFSIKVSQLPPLTKRSDFYRIQSKGDVALLNSFYLVASIERNGEMLKQNDEPVFYTAFNQKNLGELSKNNLFNAFRLPEGLKATDILKIYAWNPDKKPMNCSPIQLFYCPN